MGIDYTLLTALATWAIAFGTIGVLWWQTLVAQRLNSANAVMTLRERFDSPGLRRARRQLSERLLAGRHDDITNLEVAAYFELIGALTHRHVLDRQMVWEAFGTWIAGYYDALRGPVDVIGRARENLHDPLIMHEFEWLRGRIRILDARALRHGMATSEEEERDSLSVLRREADLDIS